MKVKLSDIEANIAFRKKICSIPLRDIEFTDDSGSIIKIDEEIIDEFIYTGLNNFDFISTGFYKTGFESFVDKDKT